MSKNNSKKRKKTKNQPLTKKTYLSLFVLLVLVVILEPYLKSFFENLDISSFSSVAVSAEHEVILHFIDVGQGDSILIESKGQYMLVDCGEREYGDVVSEYLQSLHIKKIDYIVATHPHSDHIGGFRTVIDQFDIDYVIMPNVVHTTITYEKMIDAIIDHDITAIEPVPGNTYTVGDATIIIIAPVTEYGDNLNNWSVGLRVTSGNNSFVLCGDAENKALDDMTDYGYSLDADVIKLSHHGSRTSLHMLDAEFEYAIINCALDNSYGFPHKEVIDKLTEKNIKLYRTDLQGTIVAVSDGNQISFNQKPTVSYQTGKELSTK